MNILVTGIAGDIGAGICRILKESDHVSKIYGCDIHDEHAGFSIVDQCFVIPRVSEPMYKQELLSIVENYGIDAVFITSDPELRFVASEECFRKKFGAPIVAPNKEAMDVGFDKLRTVKFISALKCESPWTLDAEIGYPLEFPCVFKGRYGAGSRTNFIVDNPKQATFYRELFPRGIWQEYIAGEHQEYTCGVYGASDGQVRTIVFRRRLYAGLTGYAELVKNNDIEDLCHKIAIGLQLRGSINIQLRMSDRGPLVFEINPRFSSTVGFRHKLGFKDVLWSLEEQVLGKDLDPLIFTRPVGTRIYRIYDEILG